MIPHIIQTCLTAQECQSVDFHSYDNMWFSETRHVFECHDGGVDVGVGLGDMGLGLDSGLNSTDMSDMSGTSGIGIDIRLSGVELGIRHLSRILHSISTDTLNSQHNPLSNPLSVPVATLVDPVDVLYTHHSDSSISNSSITFYDMWSKIVFVCLLQAIGTVIGGKVVCS